MTTLVAEAEREDLADLYRLLVDSVEDYAIYMLTADGTIASWNTGAERIKGYTAAEVLGKHFSLFYPPEEIAMGSPQHALDLALIAGHHEYEGWRVRKDGTRFWASVLMSAMRDRHGNLRGFAKVTRDLTHVRATEAQHRDLIRAQAAKAEAERNSRVKDEFLSITSHELRTPITTLKAHAQLLSRRLGDEHAEALTTIDRQCDRIVRLVNQLLDISRISLGRFDLHTRPFDLADLVVDVVNRRQATLAPGYTLTAKIVCSLPVLADYDRIEQVATNLINNAIKYTPEGGDILVTAFVETGVAVVAVQDPGIGIPFEHQPRVFERHYRAHAGTGEEHYDSMGLGLYISREIVLAHEGRIWFNSMQGSNGSGSTFFFSLPLAR